MGLFTSILSKAAKSKSVKKIAGFGLLGSKLLGKKKKKKKKGVAGVGDYAGKTKAKKMSKTYGRKK
tara:strand:+ start:943 stop:1140 length:198 start_codon:yes stop_codon:yes gene_type:complete